MKFNLSWKWSLAVLVLPLASQLAPSHAFGLGLLNQEIIQYAAEKICPGPAEQVNSQDCQSAKTNCIQELNNCFHANVESTIHCKFDDFDGGKLKCINQEVCVQETEGGCAVWEPTAYEKPLYACIQKAKQNHTQAIDNACNIQNFPAVCGDGFVSGDEICDGSLGKNNTIIAGKCSQNCRSISACGDGITEGDETCDQGPLNGTEGHCNSSCDGVISKKTEGAAFEAELGNPQPTPSAQINFFPWAGPIQKAPTVTFTAHDVIPGNFPEIPGKEPPSESEKLTDNGNAVSDRYQISHSNENRSEDEFVTMPPTESPSLQSGGCSLGSTVTDSTSSLACFLIFLILASGGLRKASRGR